MTGHGFPLFVSEGLVILVFNLEVCGQGDSSILASSADRTGLRTP